jgi:phosphatidylethanolamine N-methyltransferase
MQKLYGDRLRKDGGLTKTLKTVAGKHARRFESTAGRHAPEIKRVVSEVKDTMVRVEERVTEAVEDFLQSGQSARAEARQRDNN